ncbi:MAG: hypothetical protein FWE49_05970 [Synergistaceae bacterium]|nr:hypothetical protein [Synergistaceae bacterium]
MKRNTLLSVLVAIGINSLANHSVFDELNEFYKIRQETTEASRAGASLKDYFAHQTEIKARIDPVLHKEFAKLMDGELTPLAHDLLNDIKVIDYCYTVLRVQLVTCPVEVQTKVLEQVFTTVPDSQQGIALWSFLDVLPKEAFSGEKIQKWLVGAINDGMPGGAFYFILTDENAHAVLKMATASMKKFSEAEEHSERDLLSLTSAVFLASRGNEDAIKFLDNLLDQRDINSLFDRRYIIPAAAMSRNEKLMKKILGIVTTDKRTHSLGNPDTHEVISFAHTAAKACAFVIEGFPPVKSYRYDDATRENVRKWVESNPTYTIKSDNPHVFLRETWLSTIYPLMKRAIKRNESGED